jgi:hypothetical protein
LSDGSGAPCDCGAFEDCAQDQRVGHREEIDGWVISFMGDAWVADSRESGLSFSIHDGLLRVIGPSAHSHTIFRLPLTVVDALRRLPAWMPKLGDLVNMKDMPRAKPVKVAEACPGWRFLLDDGSDYRRECHVSNLDPAEPATP